jgi:hypothetical protein
MPIRFRKSIKIAPGTRLNLSKRGISASVGAGGLRASTGKSGNCLYYVFVWPFVFIYQLYALLFKGLVWLWKKATATPQSRRVSLITVGVVFILGLCSSAVTAITGKKPSATAQPTLDLVSIQSTALAQAWLSYTQTAAALPTNTPLPTNTFLPTDTPVPTSTLTPIPILLPTETATVFFSILPGNQEPTLITVPNQPSTGSCCKHCGASSQPCGDSCISKNYTCSKPPGCACKP